MKKRKKRHSSRTFSKPIILVISLVMIITLTILLFVTLIQKPRTSPELQIFQGKTIVEISDPSGSITILLVTQSGEQFKLIFTDLHDEIISGMDM